MATSLDELKSVLYVDRVYAALNALAARRPIPDAPVDLRLSELRIFSQNGEDGVTHALLEAIPDVPRNFMEFGVGSGWSCNTRLLAEVFGWQGTYLEVDPHDFDLLARRYAGLDRIQCACRRVSATNVVPMFEELHIPPHIGVLSIDVDGQDYWIWKALAPHFRADIVIIEVNSAHPHPYGVEQETNTFYGDLTRTWGAAPRAMAALGRSLGYRPVHVELAGANLFLVHESAVTRAPEIIGELDRVANYGLTRSGHPDSVLFPSGPGDDRPWTETTSTP